MRKAKAADCQSSRKKMRPALTPEARENQMISLAVDLAEKQLMEGTASSQVITHYLKLGSTKERIEKEILEKQKELIDAKTQSLKSAQRLEELYKNAYAMPFLLFLPRLFPLPIPLQKAFGTDTCCPRYVITTESLVHVLSAC